MIFIFLFLSFANAETLSTAARQDTANTTLSNILTQLQNQSVSKAGHSTITASASVTTASVQIIAANVNRIGLIIYNNSANSIYLAYGSAANSSNNMTRILPTFTQFVMEPPIYTGAIFGIRNAGSGTCLVTELTQ